MARAPLFRFRLPDDRKATLLLGKASTVLSVEDTLVSSWDLGGRPYALVRRDGTYRRGLDGHLLRKREATTRSPRLRQRMTATDGEPVVEVARNEAALALESLTGARPLDSAIPALKGGGAGEAAVEGEDRAIGEALRRLGMVVSMDTTALAEDAGRFLEVMGPIGILPPDQYLALVVRVTEGCAWNGCTFCSLYEGVPFRTKASEELRAHIERPAVLLRRVDRAAPKRLPRRRQRPVPGPRRARPPLRRARVRARRASPLLLRRRLDRPAQERGPVAGLRGPRPRACLRRAGDRRPGPPGLAGQARRPRRGRRSRRRASRGWDRGGSHRAPRAGGRALRRRPRFPDRGGPRRHEPPGGRSALLLRAGPRPGRRVRGSGGRGTRISSPSRPRTARPRGGRSSTCSGLPSTPPRPGPPPTTSASSSTSVRSSTRDPARSSADVALWQDGTGTARPRQIRPQAPRLGQRPDPPTRRPPAESRRALRGRGGRRAAGRRSRSPSP